MRLSRAISPTLLNPLAGGVFTLRSALSTGAGGLECSLQSVSNVAANLFPLWLVLGVVLGLWNPDLFLWFQTDYITFGLALTMLSMGTTLTFEVRRRPPHNRSCGRERLRRTDPVTLCVGLHRRSEEGHGAAPGGPLAVHHHAAYGPPCFQAGRPFPSAGCGVRCLCASAQSLRFERRTAHSRGGLHRCRVCLVASCPGGELSTHTPLLDNAAASLPERCRNLRLASFALQVWPATWSLTWPRLTCPSPC